jgi:hypothetical protein
MLSRMVSVYFSIVVVVLSFCVGVGPWHVRAEVVDSLLLACSELLSGLLAPVRSKEFLFSIEVRFTMVLIGWFVTMIVNIGMGVMGSDLIGCLLVVLLRSIEFFPFSMKWVLWSWVHLVVFRLRRHMSNLRDGFVMFHGRLRVGESHACGVPGEREILL